jgi:hypothetical protein
MIPKAERKRAWPANLNRLITRSRNLLADANFRSVVLILLLEMFDTQHHFSFRGALAPQLVCDDHTWDIPQPC